MEEDIKVRLGGLRDFYDSGGTRDVHSRIVLLREFERAVKACAGDIAEALRQDLGKSPEESYLTETAIVLGEIRTQVRNLRKWAKGRRVGSPLAIFPSRSRIFYEPKGVVLIMAPWNYPLQLALDPLVGAIAAGNCVALKPSTTSAATCAVIKSIIAEVFPENMVAVFDGDHDQAADLLTYRFDHIFFTGGSGIGKMVMKAAAENLTPVTLELGGKSPCIVDKDADLDVAARRIVWGKLINAGQTCIAPDHLFVHRDVKEALIGKMREAVERFYGTDIRNNPAYPRIITDKAFARLKGYLDGPGDIIWGGECDAAERFIAPTLMENIPADAPVMREEIFGPIMPVQTFEYPEAVARAVNGGEKPLALYYFGTKRGGTRMLAMTTSGGACINDTIVHIVNNKLPFGGVGMSGMGRYHGRHSFETFSNARGTVISPTRPDIKLRYPPYARKFGWLKKIM